MVAAELVFAHVMHIGNHNFNHAIGHMRRSSKKVNNCSLSSRHESLWDRVTLEAERLKEMIFLSKMERRVRPELKECYTNIQDLLKQIDDVSEEITQKHAKHHTEHVKGHLCLGRNVHKTLVKVIHEHGINPDYHKKEEPPPTETSGSL